VKTPKQKRLHIRKKMFENFHLAAAATRKKEKYTHRKKWIQEFRWQTNRTERELVHLYTTIQQMFQNGDVKTQNPIAQKLDDCTKATSTNVEN